MEKKYNFQKTAPVAFSALWDSLDATQYDPSEFARFQIFIFEKPVICSMDQYPVHFESRSLYPQLANEMFMLKIDLRNAWSTNHFRPHPDAVCWWLKENSQKIGEKEYVSYLVTELGIYYLHFDMEHGEVTFRVFIRSLNEPAVPAVESAEIKVNSREVYLIRTALSYMYTILAKQGAAPSDPRMMEVTRLSTRLHEELQACHKAEQEHNRNIGSKVS